MKYETRALEPLTNMRWLVPFLIWFELGETARQRGKVETILVLEGK